MTQFYTYLWLREDGTPYYVGKGCGNRAYTSTGHKVRKPKCKTRVLVQRWESEEEALQMEKWWIALFGRKDIGTGTLRNRLDGGDKVPPSYNWYGREHTEDTKAKMSASAKKRWEAESSERRSAIIKKSWVLRRQSLEKPTHCKNGHELTKENTYVAKKGTTVCNVCRRKDPERTRSRGATA